MSEMQTKLVFDWDISKDLLHSFYFKHFKKDKNDFCMSALHEHKYTQTVWALRWFSRGKKNRCNENQSKIYLMLVHKPFEIKNITIHKTLHCKQSNLTLTDEKNTIYDYCGQGMPWIQRYSIIELQKYSFLSFKCEITFMQPTFHGFCFTQNRKKQKKKNKTKQNKTQKMR